MESRPLRIDRELVRQLEELSGMELSDSEREAMREHLDRMLTFARKLQELDTDDIEPSSHPFPLEAPRRPDVVQASLAAAEALSQSPARDDRYFVVPPVMPDDDAPDGDGRD